MIRRDDSERIVITGVGVVSPVGIGREQMWGRVTAGESGAGPITLFDASDFAVQIACEASEFVATDFIERRASRRMDRYAQMAVAAARMAIDDSGLPIDADGAGIGAVIGNGGSGATSREEQHRLMIERGVDRISPFSIPLAVANMGAGQVSIELGLRGPVMAVCTACASGTDSIGTAADIIRRGDARAMLAGGADCLITPYYVAGFHAMKVLSSRAGDPAAAPRPFDRDRDGFLIGEGGVVLVLEPLSAARARGAQILCEVAGYGASNDGHHITEPDPESRPQIAAVRAALADAGLEPGEIEHVNAHGGGSRPGDPSEIRVARAVFGEQGAARISFTATKSMHGHCMGAAGALETAITALTIHEGLIPPNRNLLEIDPECAGVDHVAGEARRATVNTALCTSYGLGGHNSVVALSRVESD